MFVEISQGLLENLQTVRPADTARDVGDRSSEDSAQEISWLEKRLAFIGELNTTDLKVALEMLEMSASALLHSISSQEDPLNYQTLPRRVFQKQGSRPQPLQDLVVSHVSAYSRYFSQCGVHGARTRNRGTFVATVGVLILMAYTLQVLMNIGRRQNDDPLTVESSSRSDAPPRL